ncbi:hypothetical protein [Urbifossiella limnaea]|uniref:Putative subtilase-type serine protease n=1 Tax=Urbifossiella limnaea TaxID=2528023 RepID=A0A517XZL2_9BACT|nr:hypothetical protein [Urbifossiella limnaea]QDU22898.1 putative subtilase-type serine protease precursor [Urbifossiella limnaea]
MPRAALLFLLTIPVAASAPVAAQPKQPDKKKDTPKVLYAAPLVATPGARQKLTLRGKHLDAVKEVTASDGTAVKVLGAKKAAAPNNYPADRVGDTEVEVELTLPKGAKPGVSLAPAGGGPYTLLIPDELPAVAEKEPNDGYDAAQPLTPPCAVVGVIHQEKNPDVFRVAGKAGQKLRAEVQAARFGSPLDGILTVVDENRRFVAANDDAGASRDPAVVVTLPRDGVYFLSLIDAHDMGGAGFGYRLVVRLE